MLTETWLNKEIEDSVVNIEEYTLFRKDRQNRIGGGVAILVRKEVNGHLTYPITLDNVYNFPTIDSLWLEIKIADIKIRIACIYRPDYISRDENTKLIEIVNAALSTNSPTYIFGDFNYPEIDWKNLILNRDKKTPSLTASDFLDSYKENNAVQCVKFVTRIRKEQESLLDLILVNDKKLIFNLTRDPPLGLSDHIVIRASSQLKARVKPTRVVMNRNFWKADYHQINNFIEQNLTVNDASLTNCSKIIKDAINIYVPERSKRINPQKPWLSNSIFKEIDRKRRLWDNYVKNKTENNYATYRTQNNKLKNTIIEARVHYERDISISSDKKFYSYIKRTLKSNVTNIVLRDSSTKEIISDPEVSAEAFATQFSSVFTQEDPEEIPLLSATLRCEVSISTINFTPEKVEEAIMSLKPESSPGPDNIPAVLLQKCVKSLSAPLAGAMNHSMNNEILPSQWTEAYVIPIFKKGDKYFPENYRPISLTCNPCKCMEKIIVKELTEFLLTNNVLPNVQHGFLPKRSVETNLLICLQQWTKDHDDNLPTDIIYLDFEKAFDKVPFKRLLYKLQHLGIRGDLLNWIRHFLEDRTYQVRVNGVHSAPHEVLSGVPQGSVLGPLLFLIYISDMAENIKTNISFFADDTKLHCNPLTQSGELADDLQTLERWTETWLMPLNNKKCTILHVGPKNPHIQYQLNGSQLMGVVEQKDLGVTITSDLKWQTHISHIVKRANKLIYLIQKAFQHKSSDMILQIYKAYIRPILEYAQCVWSPYYAKDIEILERVQRKVTRIPFELRNLSYQDRLRRLNLTTLRERRQRGDLIQTYKILNGYYSIDLNIYKANDNRNLRGHSKKLEKERCAKLTRRNFLINRVVYVWNGLSQNTVQAPSLNSFKNHIDKDMKILGNCLVHYGV